MSVKSVQFAVAAHIMAALGYFHGEEISSAILAVSVNADPTFVRKSLSKLSKAGLVVTKRGKSGASMLSHSPRQITLLDIYRASAAPPAFAIHSYPVEKKCPVSCHLKECMAQVFAWGKRNFRRRSACRTSTSGGEQAAGSRHRYAVGLPWPIRGGFASRTARAGRRNAYGNIFQGRGHCSEGRHPFHN